MSSQVTVEALMAKLSIFSFLFHQMKLMFHTKVPVNVKPHDCRLSPTGAYHDISSK